MVLMSFENRPIGGSFLEVAGASGHFSLPMPAVICRFMRKLRDDEPESIDTMP